MPEACQDLLPFYAAGGLSTTERATVEAHLADCAACRAALREWRAIAEVVRAESAARAVELPSLSPVVRANLCRRPTVAQALRSAASLVWAQRVVMAGRGFVFLALVLGVLATLSLGDGVPVAFPLLALTPPAAALGVAFLYGPGADSAFEIVATTPTPPGALLLARLTLLLSSVGGVAMPLSLLLSGVGGVAFVPLVGAWLGPLLSLSALATVLALLWRPMIAASVTLTLWAGVVVLLVAELDGRSLVQASLRPLLQPDWALFMAQVAAAELLWALGGVLLARDTLPTRKLEAAP